MNKTYKSIDDNFIMPYCKSVDASIKHISSDDVLETINKIYDVIEYYESYHCEKPRIIILSIELSKALNYMNCNSVYETNLTTYTHTLFGIECVESPVLVDLEYKVY